MSRSWSSSALSKSPSLSSISLRDGAQRAYTRLMQGNTRSVQVGVPLILSCLSFGLTFAGVRLNQAAPTGAG